MGFSQNGAYRNINGKLYTLKPRDYVVAIAHTGVAGTAAVGVINIDPAAVFLMTDRFMSDTVDPALVAPGLDGQYDNFIQVQDSSNGYNWSNAFVPRSAFARDKRHGYRLTDEVMIAANTRLVLTIVEPAAAPAAGVTTIVLQGFSIYSTN
jgi:hypothetical protein